SLSRQEFNSIFATKFAIFTMIYPLSFEVKLGFDKIRQHVSTQCATQGAREILEKTRFCADFDTLKEQLEQVAEMQKICLFEDKFPHDNYVDVTLFLRKARVPGVHLSEAEFFAIEQLLTLLDKLRNFFHNVEKNSQNQAQHYPRLSGLLQPLQVLPQVQGKINTCIDHLCQVKDTASTDLQKLRQEMFLTQQQIARRMQKLLRQAQSSGFADAEAELSLRDGRAVIPIAAGSKRKIAGIILDESASGKTAFIEPAEVVELNNRLKELGFAEKREIIKILTTLTDFIRPFLLPIEQSASTLCLIDFVRAKALYSNQIKATLPALVNESSMDWKHARHPLMEAALRKEHKKIIPLHLRLSAQKRQLIISGPNAGGKSAVLKTVGLLQYMLQCGFPIPLAGDSEVGIFEHIFIDIGDEQSIENDLSTYSSHLRNMKYILRNANAQTLVLLDELGTGTEPQAGGAIAEAILEEIAQKQSFVLATTHYANLKQLADNTATANNGAMLFDVQKIAPLFTLDIGVPGSSFAFELAQKIGLPQTVLKKAQNLLGSTYLETDKSLRDIARNRRYWEEKRTRIKNTDKTLEDTLQRYQTELQQLHSERNAILNKAKQEAKQLINNANKEIENTIRSIKEAQAEKEKTRQLRISLSQFSAESTTEEERIITQKIEQKIERLKKQQQQRATRKSSPQAIASKSSENESQPKIMTQGMYVKVEGQNAVGEIINLNENGTATLAIGNLFLNIKLHKLSPLNRVEQRTFQQTKNRSTSPSLSVKRLNFSPNIDVRGLRVDEALAEIEPLLDQALMFGESELRILHGKGTGILKQQIRNYLQGIRSVVSIEDESELQGGAGISIVKLG
ncbi:MAG: endonuclease MutS2, partial [Bacteroidales bacterium]